jgi:tRNA nucleotidyltransferase (CCA-adding enzyme)
MLRAYRFAAVLGFTIDAAAAGAIQNLRERITGISAERIRMELDKLLMSGNFELIGDFFEMFGDIILPEAKVGFDVLKRTQNVLCRRLAALFQGYPDVDEAVRTAGAVMRRLTYDNKTVKLVKAVISSRAVTFNNDRAEMKRLMRRFGVDELRHCLAYLTALDAANEALASECSRLIDDILSSGEAWLTSHLAINGSDIMGAGITAGKDVGEALGRLLEAVVEDNGLNNKNVLLDVIKGWYTI